jgi:mycoredoxin
MDTATPLDGAMNGAAQGVVTVYTTSWCGDCQVAKRALTQASVPFQEVNIEGDPAAADYVVSVNGGRRSVPTLVYEGDAVSLSRFSRERLDAFLRKHQLV